MSPLPPRGPSERAARNNVFITLHDFGPPADPARPLPRRRRSFHRATNPGSRAREGGPGAARPRRARGPGRGGAGRVRGLGPHERGLRRGLQPREERRGFRGAPQLILVIRRARRAGARACCSGLAPPPSPRSPPASGAARGPPAGRRGRDPGAPQARVRSGELGHGVAARVGALPREEEVRERNTHGSGGAASPRSGWGRSRGQRALGPAAPAPAARPSARRNLSGPRPVSI